MKIKKMRSPKRGVDIFGLFTDAGAPCGNKMRVYGGANEGTYYHPWDDISPDTLKKLFVACGDCVIEDDDIDMTVSIPESAWDEYRALLAKI